MVDETSVSGLLLRTVHSGLVEWRKDGLVLVHILNRDLSLRSAADKPYETDEQDNGVDDVRKADDYGDAVDNGAGSHHVLGELGIVHDP